MLILHNDYIACSDYFRLSVYTWDIILVYICRRLSSWLRFHVFWEAGRDSFPTKLDSAIVHTGQGTVKDLSKFYGQLSTLS